ncbi:hypothetical protein HanOQP8_Chr14g0507661 [Helianthus annuus]|nr:hypothetical protein HanOQP8_Chr14g0507661 [Helianthus annuus]
MMTQTRNYLVKTRCLKVHLQGPRGGHTIALRFEQLKNFKPPGDGSALVMEVLWLIILQTATFDFWWMCS